MEVEEEDEEGSAAVLSWSSILAGAAIVPHPGRFTIDALVILLLLPIHQLQCPPQTAIQQDERDVILGILLLLLVPVVLLVVILLFSRIFNQTRWHQR